MVFIGKDYTAREASLLPPGLMAYVGDSVYELMVRKYFLDKGYRKLHDIHQNSIKMVNATSQADFLRDIEAILTEDEKNIVRRGKNTKTGNVPANAEMIDYRMSTGFEALFGYLFLSGQEDRIGEIWGTLISSYEETD